jgi:hypothetical protein
VRLDKNSNVLWALPANTHHDIVVDEDGTIVVPSMRYRPEGLPGFPHLKPWYYEDTVLRVSPTGEVLGETSVLRSLLNYPGLLSINYGEDLGLEAEDVTHLDAAEPLPAALADRFPMFAPGDLLVSLRNIDTIAVIDPRTERTRWAPTGPFAKQHDPDRLPNGHIVVFDNAGGAPPGGGGPPAPRPNTSLAYVALPRQFGAPLPMPRILAKVAEANGATGDVPGMEVPDRELVLASGDDSREKRRLVEAVERLLGERKVVAERKLEMQGANLRLPHLGIIDGVQGHLRETDDGQVLLEHKGA